MASSAAKGKAPANGAASSLPYELPWYDVPCLRAFTADIVLYRVEKYRPKILNDIVGNSETIERLKVIARDGNCPHIIISVSVLRPGHA